MQQATPSTTADCPYCGVALKRKDVTIFGKARTVTCFGSCGCAKSAEKLAQFGSPSGPSVSGHRCPTCGGSMTLDGRTGYVSDCPWCGYSCVFSSDLDAHNEGVAMSRKSSVLEGTGVPELFWDVEPDEEMAARIAETGVGLYVTGGNGTAKTLMAAAISKAYAEAGRKVRFASSVKMLSEFRDSYGGERSEADVFAELNGCDLLVVDDMGKENPTSWAATMLYAVIDGRYGSGRPVVVTTNYSEGELVARMAKASDESTARALMSRLMEMTEKVVLDGPDRRLA